MSNTAIVVRKAVKYDAKARVALVGPAGSGKSFTGLELARKLAGPDGKILSVDTEHGSLSKYADLHEFDVIEPDSYDVQLWLDYLTHAEKNAYAVFFTDSLSHYWMGKDGALEFVDMASRRGSKGDSFSGWKEFRPQERMMVDRMIASSCHIICTMRTKNEYVDEINERGKKVRRKIGLAPVQRDGLEYEFDLVGYMDDENSLIVDKTRCQEYRQKVIKLPKGKDFDPFLQWLKGAKRETPVVLPPDTRPIDTDGHPEGTAAAQQAVLNRKLSVMEAPDEGATDWSAAEARTKAFLDAQRDKFQLSTLVTHVMAALPGSNKTHIRAFCEGYFGKHLPSAGAMIPALTKLKDRAETLKNVFIDDPEAIGRDMAHEEKAANDLLAEQLQASIAAVEGKAKPRAL